MRGLGCGKGAACYYFGKRGLKAIQNARLSPRFWVGCLVKWRRHLTSAAARVVQTGGNGVEMVARGVGCGGGCLVSFWKEGTPS
jgi:hypothetical protein